MKRNLIYPLILIAILGLCGCSKSQLTIGSMETNTMNKTSMSYLLFTGSKEKKLTVNENEPLTVSVDIETEEGSLDVSIYNEAGEYSYEGHDIETSTFTVTLSEAGKYTIKVEADEHKGSYSFTW